MANIKLGPLPVRLSQPDRTIIARFPNTRSLCTNPLLYYCLIYPFETRQLSPIWSARVFAPLGSLFSRQCKAPDIRILYEASGCFGASSSNRYFQFQANSNPNSFALCCLGGILKKIISVSFCCIFVVLSFVFLTRLSKLACYPRHA
jgi:hypothetical protein